MFAVSVAVTMVGQTTTPKPNVTRFLPTSELVRVASMAARDEGYNVEAQGIYLDELRTANCRPPLPGYDSIALYFNDHPVRTYSIRVDTGDVLDENACVVFRYPNLIKFRNETLKGAGTKPVSLETMAAEVGCEKLEVLPHDRAQH
jgi:hypothetical protein